MLVAQKANTLAQKGCLNRPKAFSQRDSGYHSLETQNSREKKDFCFKFSVLIMRNIECCPSKINY